MKWSCICLQLLFCVSSANAQEPNFYNTNQSLLALNPSFAGSNGFGRNQFSYRTQLPNSGGALLWYNNTFDAFIRRVNGGIGMSVSAENQAKCTYVHRSLALSYAQHLSLPGEKVLIIPSLEVRYCLSGLDIWSLHYGDVVNVRLGDLWTNLSTLPVTRRSYTDIAAGLLFHFANSYVGGSVSHLNMPYVSHLLPDYRMPATINLHASTTYKFGTACLIQGLLRYKRFANLASINAQVNAVVLRHLIVGAGWWSFDTFTANAGFRGHGFTIGAGYDVSMSLLAGTPAASWEIHCSLNLRDKINNVHLEAFEKM